MTADGWLAAYAGLWALGLGLIAFAAVGQWAVTRRRARLFRANSTAASSNARAHAGAVPSEQRSRRPPCPPMTDAHTPGAGRHLPRPASPGPLTDRSRPRGHGPQL